MSLWFTGTAVIRRSQLYGIPVWPWIMVDCRSANWVCSRRYYVCAVQHSRRFQPDQVLLCLPWGSRCQRRVCFLAADPRQPSCCEARRFFSRRRFIRGHEDYCGWFEREEA